MAAGMAVAIDRVLGLRFVLSAAVSILVACCPTTHSRARSSLQPVEDAQVQVLFKHSKVRQPGEGEWKLAFVHEACFTPVMHRTTGSK